MTADISIAVLEVPAFCPVVECSECDDHSCEHNQNADKPAEQE
ncbi:hypothetical protein [Enterobacter asburiae]|nr:hypothetical protein [Enterobacter asburiae]